MTLLPLDIISAEKVVKEIQTSGSGPLLILGKDTNVYYAKTTGPIVPRIELINEVLCGYLAQCWGLQVPGFCLIKIPDSVIENYKSENGNLSRRYDKVPFSSDLFFGSRQAQAFELEQYFHGLKSKNDYKLFDKPLDLIKIGVFDIWVGNKDRKPDNPNVLLGSNEKFIFQPIDHTAAFAHCTNYRQVTEAFIHLEDRFRLLNIPLVKSIAKFETAERLNGLMDEIDQGIELSLQHMDFIFDQIPAAWGFSKKAKQHLRDFLSLEKRNSQMKEVFNSYLK